MAFEIQTPPNLPNTFCYKFNEHTEDLKVVIKYEVAAALMIPGTESAIASKTKIEVKSNCEYQEAEAKSQNQKEVKGDYHFSVEINRSSFTYGESVNAMVKCDNSNGESDVEQLQWKLVQYLTFHTKDSKFKKEATKILKQGEIEGVKSG